MTVPTDSYTEDAEDYEGFDAEVPVAPLPVRVTGRVGRRQAPHFGSWQVYTIPVAGTGFAPVQILQRRSTREQAFIYSADSNLLTAAPVTLQNTGAVTNPGVNTNIAIKAITQSGNYLVSWSVGLPGGGAAGDQNNMGLFTTAIQATALLDPFVTTNQAQPAILLPLTAGTNLSIKSIAAASGAGIIYAAQLIAQLQGQSNANPVLLNKDPGALQLGLGFGLDVGNDQKYEAQEQVYALVPVGGSPVTLYVLDESYDEEWSSGSSFVQ